MKGPRAFEGKLTRHICSVPYVCSGDTEETMGSLTLVRDDTRGVLTDRQREILEFITQSIRERGYPPTLREIGVQFGIRSTNGVNDHLRALEKKGYLEREDLKSRALRPTTMGSSATGVAAAARG